jgi:hypothetical protein
MRILNPLLATLSAGYILMYYSEFLFWARTRPGDSFLGWLMTWLVYSFLAFAFLSVIARFRVSSFWGLFLAGAAFGWLAEGLVVQTTYENLPFSISFTGLAWHALISVGVGWYAVRRALPAGLGHTAALSAAAGLAYGLWAISWWLEPEGGQSSLPAFALFSLATGLLLALAYWLYDRCMPVRFSPGRGVQIGVGGLFVLYFTFVTVPSSPIAALILPLLLGLVYLALRPIQREEGQAAMLFSLPSPYPAWMYLGLLVLPLTAILFYALAFYLHLRWHANWILYLVATPAGFIVFIISYLRLMRMKAVKP